MVTDIGDEGDTRHRTDPARGLNRRSVARRRRETTGAYPVRKALRKFRSRVFPVGGDEFLERGEDRGLSHAIGIKTIKLGFGESFGHITERHTLFFGHIVEGRLGVFVILDHGYQTSFLSLTAATYGQPRVPASAMLRKG